MPQKQHRASISGKKLTGRPNMVPNSSSSSLVRQASGLSLTDSQQLQQSGPESYFDSQPNADPKKVLAQVSEWLRKEKSKAFRRKMANHQHGHKKSSSLDPSVAEAKDGDRSQQELGEGDSGIALEKLETIMAAYMKTAASKMDARSPMLAPRSPGPATPSRKSSIASKFKRNSVVNLSSDTEFFGDEVLVPGVEANLDNSRTLAYSGGIDEGDDKTKGKDYKCWVTFKEDILRITHTLKLKGWRRIQMEDAAKLDVARLSGALTNAVYVVKPPKADDLETNKDGRAKPPRPKYLLLRIYGPQSDHLIDRDAELGILRRLAQKKIGPRMLGTFTNGRFEEYLHSTTLEAQDLRIPETSKQIAKRMRELHDGIDLINSEIEAGPAIFNTFDKYLDRCQKVITFLDRQVQISLNPPPPPSNDPSARPQLPPVKYTRYGLVCGTEWPLFQRTYDRYRARLVKECGGNTSLRRKLVFAHNDTQYGNLMRLKPSGESPLLQPSNHHKQLVVIDFEYAGQNTIGLEFANHFSEWCYNYHHPSVPWACHTQAYPTEEEQRRFIRSYVLHRPQFNPSASSTPMTLQGRERTNIPEFMLDARAPGTGGAGSGPGTPTTGTNYDAEESARETKLEEDIKQLMYETRLWRIANSAHWISWGLVQAKVPELDREELSKGKKAKAKAQEVLGKVVEGVKSGFSGRRGSKGVQHEGTGVGKVIAEPLEGDEVVVDDETGANGAAKKAEKNTETNAAATGNDENSEVETGAETEEEKGQLGDPEDEEFDYLAYAQDRALFFWGDALQMGLVDEEELSADLLGRIKTVSY